MRVGLTLVWVLVVAGAALAGADAGLQVDEATYDFGQVGVDYQVYHNYKLFTNGTKPIRIESLKVSCDCSTAYLTDSTVRPGDTVQLELSFNTRDFYGRTSKSLTVYTNDPRMPKFELYYLSTIGQWLAGLKPEPIALFFLPGHKSKPVTITNTQFDEYTLEPAGCAHTFVSTSLSPTVVTKGQTKTFDVHVGDDLGPGTWNSSVRVKASVKGIAEPVYITIPIKIVRY
jgi:hypothetical protein